MTTTNRLADNDGPALKVFEQRRRATERTAMCYLAAFAQAHWNDFEAFLKDHDEGASHFLPIVEEWNQTHSLYQSVRAGLPQCGVSDEDLRQLGGRMQFLADDFEYQSTRIQRAFDRDMKPTVRLAEALLPLVEALRQPVRPRAEGEDDLIEAWRTVNSAPKRQRIEEP